MRERPRERLHKRPRARERERERGGEEEDVAELHALLTGSTKFRTIFFSEGSTYSLASAHFSSSGGLGEGGAGFGGSGLILDVLPR